MKIELRNIRFSEHLSEETNAFTANIYVNGVHAGAASNHGTGGPTDYYPVNENGKKLIREAEAYCAKLPPEKYMMEGKEYTIDMSLEYYIDNLLSKNLEEKELKNFRKNIDKAMQGNIVIGIPDDSFKKLPLKFSIKHILTHLPDGEQKLKELIINKVLPHLKDGDIILNTNIPEKILKAAGLNEQQYVKPDSEVQAKKTQQKRKGL